MKFCVFHRIFLYVNRSRERNNGSDADDKVRSFCEWKKPILVAQHTHTRARERKVFHVMLVRNSVAIENGTVLHNVSPFYQFCLSRFFARSKWTTHKKIILIYHDGFCMNGEWTSGGAMVVGGYAECAHWVNGNRPCEWLFERRTCVHKFPETWQCLRVTLRHILYTWQKASAYIGHSPPTTARSEKEPPSSR